MASDEEEKYLALIQKGERDLGESHPALTYPLAYLGDACSQERRNTEAEQFYTRAITIWEEHDPDNLRMAQPLNNLGNLYTYQERYAEAEPLFERALHIQEQHGEKGESLYPSLSNLTLVYLMQGKAEQAGATYQRREEIANTLDTDSIRHWYPVQWVNINVDENPYQVAEAAYQQALKEHHLENWQETKRQMQGAVEIRIGKDSTVDWQKLSALELSDAIAQDSITHNADRTAEIDREPER